MKKLIMCDLDCTLLPIKQSEFDKLFYQDVSKIFSLHGYDSEKMLDHVKKGFYAMYFNNGEKTNEEAFFDASLSDSGITKEEMLRAFDEYYETHYENIRETSWFNPYAEEIVNLIEEHADKKVLATQAMFPLYAVDKRMHWTGISADRFDFVTTYDSSSFCKPNVGYYEEILDKFNVSAKDALMIGNDVKEDILPCKSLGVDTFLVTDQIITHNLDYSDLKRGTYSDLIKFLKEV